MSTNDGKLDVETLKSWQPGKVGITFINNYLGYHKDESKKEFLENLSISISKLDLDDVLKVYELIEKQTKAIIKSEMYERVPEYKGMMEYFKEHVLDWTKWPKNY